MDSSGIQAVGCHRAPDRQHLAQHSSFGADMRGGGNGDAQLLPRLDRLTSFFAKRFGVPWNPSSWGITEDLRGLTP